jgi:ribosomal-protein-alanine N-acetyltransferase
VSLSRAPLNRNEAAATLMELTGPTLHLRPLWRADAPRILELLHDPEVPRFFLWEPPHTLAEARAYVEGFQYEVQQRRAYHFGIEQRRTGDLLGVANLYHIDRHAREAEIGIWLGRTYWGQGIQPEVSRLLLRCGFETLRLERLLFRVAVENARAQAAFRRLGAAECDRVLLFSQRQDRLVEHVVYVFEAAQWETAGGLG